MKKILLIGLMLGLLLACSDTTDEEATNNEVENNVNALKETAEQASNETSAEDNNNNEADDDTSNNTTDEDQIEVDKNLLSVEVTLPASIVGTEEKDIDDSIAEAEAEDMEVVKNDDGSLTYKMTKATHKAMMQELTEETEKSIDELTTSGDFKSIQTIDRNTSFSKFEVAVDSEAYENSMDGFALLGIGMSGMMYQLFDGVAKDDYDVTIKVKDDDTGDVIDTIQYPQDMVDMEDLDDVK